MASQSPSVGHRARTSVHLTHFPSQREGKEMGVGVGGGLGSRDGSIKKQREDGDKRYTGVFPPLCQCVSGKGMRGARPALHDLHWLCHLPCAHTHTRAHTAAQVQKKTVEYFLDETQPLPCVKTLLHQDGGHVTRFKPQPLRGKGGLVDLI